MLKKLRDNLINLINSRVFLLVVIMLCLGTVLVGRIFDLQIIQGETLQSEFQLKIQKERTIGSTRGNIYDCNGVLLAYNELAHSVTIEDVYESGSTKNAQINTTLKKVLSVLEDNGDKISCSFDIYIDEDGEFAFDVSGTKLLRFLADVYGYAKIEKLSEKEKNSTAQDVIEYLGGTKRYGVGERLDPEDKKSEFVVGKGYTQKELLNIIIIRYAMSTLSYQKYIPTTIATDVSEETVAVIRENSQELPGIDIAEDTIRKYVDGACYSHVIGYTGAISQEEYDALVSSEGMEGVEKAINSKEYELTDIIGKSGIEKVMDEYLQGTKGSETVFVDKMGREIETTDRVEPVAGDNVYLTIDAELTKEVYYILEQHVAGILLNNIINTKDYDASEITSASNIRIPIDDVFFALFNNNVIDMKSLEADDAEAVEKAVYEAFLVKKEEVSQRLKTELTEGTTPYNKLSDEYQDYESYIVNTLLKSSNVLTGVDTEDEMYIKWTKEEVISLREYLRYAISQNWIDVTKLEISQQYADSEEVYKALVEYILGRLDGKAFSKYLYKYMIKEERINGRQVCQLLIEQDAINPTEEEINALSSGAVSDYDFMISLIENLEITPAQLALDPYSASCVIVDVNSGDVKAIVSYPSYDNNRLANGIDSEYYARISSGEDLSRPMWNYATQMKTAPGSTFKMVSSATGLMEGIINLSSHINCTGYFNRFSDRTFKCWIVPNGSHGELNVAGGITNSCNVFFYELGYLAGINGDRYDSDLANEKLYKYADLFGLTETSGIEIEESEPQVSTDLSILSYIGQGNNNFTTVGLARYVASVANSGTTYDLTLLDKVTDHSGNLLKDYSASVRNTVDLPTAYWDSIHSGMRGVVTNKKYFNEFPVTVAGKTGTAQEDLSRPNHGLFVGYAPYEQPEAALAIRIANGYSSDYAAQAAKDILSVYFDTDGSSEVVSGTAERPEYGVSGGD